MNRVSEATAKRLFALSGNRCAFPKCETLLFDSLSGTMLGRICHIKAKSPNGPRYDAMQSDEERSGFSNLLLLCPIHHEVIDADEEAYTVERLIRMKCEHEEHWKHSPLEMSDEAAHALVNLSLVVSGSSNIAVEHMTGGQVAHAITNILTAPVAERATDPAAQHDVRIFRESSEILSEDTIDRLFEDLLGGHNYYEHQSEAIQRFISFSAKVTNEFLDQVLEGLSRKLAGALNELINFMALKFWVWPEDQERDDLRFCMYPWGNIDRGGHGEADAEKHYAELEKQLRELVNNASTAFVTYRRYIKQRYFI